MQIPYINLGLQHLQVKDDILKSIEKILTSGQFILGQSLQEFEQSFATLCGTKYALGVANGTDALILSMRAIEIGQGDEVITAPNSFLSSASSIILSGAKPVFADVRDDFNVDPEKIKKVITSHTKAIIAVHLTGHPAEMEEILKIAQEYKIAVIEDAAQAVGAEYKGKKVGSFGITGCFSLHPLKNLSACGDGGVIITNNDEVYNKLIKTRNHGLKNRDECECWSFNSRLDNLQAAILNIKIKKIQQWNDRRRQIASTYQHKFKTLNILLPEDKEYEKSVYHTFIIQTDQRDKLKDYLFTKGIDTKIHYPIPIHLQQAAKELNYKKGDFPIAEKQCQTILSLPIYPELTDEQVDYIANTVISFYLK